MMKKTLLIALCAACLLLNGCGKDAATVSSGAAPAKAIAENTAAPVSAAAAEIDLTSMSSTMVYSYVFNMVNAPNDFIGQWFRIRGNYDEEYWDQTKLTYHYIVIADATACCAQGLEFVLTDINAAYPQVGEEFEISGTFGTYTENGNLYIRITADQIARL